jgi:hypothetical protein
MHHPTLVLGCNVQASNINGAELNFQMRIAIFLSARVCGITSVRAGLQQTAVTSLLCPLSTVGGLCGSSRYQMNARLQLDPESKYL